MYVKVRVYPGAKRESVTKTGEHAYELVVRAPKERNLANERVRALVAAEYGVVVSQVRIVTGHRSAQKILDVTVRS